MRTSDGGSYFEHVQKVTNELNVKRNEVNGIDEVWKVVVVILVMLYDSEVCNKSCAKSKCSKKVEEEIKHRVANPKLKVERRKQKRRVESF